MKCTSLPAKGFTLVELMIVVVVLGILAAVAVPAYFNHILRSHQSDAYHNLLDIKAAQETVYSLSNSYSPNPKGGESMKTGKLLTVLFAAFLFSTTNVLAESVTLDLPISSR